MSSEQQLNLLCSNLVDIVLRQRGSKLPSEAAQQLTKIMCLSGQRYEPAITSSIQRFRECWDDVQAIHQYPRMLFDHPTIGKRLSDSLARKRRDLRHAKSLLDLLDVQIVKASMYGAFDPDQFEVDETHPTTHQRYHDTVCQMFRPAFVYLDQNEQPQVEPGSISVYLYEAEAVEDTQEYALVSA